MTTDETFIVVSACRFYLGLSKRDMASLLGVSRQTYHTWSRGGEIKDSQQIRERAQHVVAAAKEAGWAKQGPKYDTSSERKHQLLALLGED